MLSEWSWGEGREEEHASAVGRDIWKSLGERMYLPLVE